MSCQCNKFTFEEKPDVFQMFQGGGGAVKSVNGKTGVVVLDAGDIGYDGETTYPDASVGKELGTINSALTALSSVTEIIDTASGAIASFPDGSGLPMRSLVAEINPVQAGTGDPSPDNIRPISGHTGLSVEVKGGNLLDKTGAVRGGFDASGNVLVNSGDSRCVTVFLEVKPNVTYYIDQTIPLTQGRAGFWYDANQAAISQISFNGAGVSSGAVTSPANAKYCRLGYLATNEDVCTMTVGTSALTPYEPYTSGTTTTVSWQDEAGTVYGGTDEVVVGELTSTMGKKNIPLTNFAYNPTINCLLGYSSYGFFSDAKAPANNNTPFNAIADSIKINSAGAINGGADGLGITTSKDVYLRCGGFSSKQEYLDAFPNGIDVVYELDTPQAYQLSPQQIETLVGQNNVWVDTGDVTVTYQANIKGYIDKVLGQ